MASSTPSDLFFYEELVILPIKTPLDTSGFAIDMGSSLIKLAYTTGCTLDGMMKLRLLTAECNRLDDVLEFILEEVLPIVSSAKHKFAEACGLGFIINRAKISSALSTRFDETSEHACISKAFHFGMSFLKPREQFIREVTKLCLHKQTIAGDGSESPKGWSPVGVPSSPTHWVYKAGLEEESPRATRRAGGADLLNPVSAGVPCGGGHWICGKEDDFDPTMLKDDFPCLICNMGSQSIFIVVGKEGIGNVVYRSDRGGLYFYGLGKLVTKAKNFSDLMRMVHAGETSHLSRCLQDLPQECHLHFDLKSVEEIQSMVNLAIQIDPFSKVITDGIEDAEPEDFAKTLHSAVCIETIGITNLLARLFKVNTVYYAGNFVRNNEFFTSVLNMTPVLDKVLQYPMTVKSCYVGFGGYLGVIGAALVGLDGINRGW